MGGACSTDHYRLVTKWLFFFFNYNLYVSSVGQDDRDGVDRSSSVEEEVNTAAEDSLQTDRGEGSKVTPYGPHGSY